QRGLVIGVVDGNDGPGMFALDNRQARRRLGRTTIHSRLVIPNAYALDDLTIALVWAVDNLDDALLGDDDVLAQSQQQLARYHTLDRSSAGRDAAADLGPVSQAWLGSEFCARYILRHSAELTELPVFWTREQRGEEACTWLLFRHKYV